MTLKELVKRLAKREGKKSQVKIGDIREIVGIMSDLLIEEPGFVRLLLDNGYRRQKRKKK